MKAVNLIANALRNSGLELPELPEEPIVDICAVTGEECLCVPRKSVLAKSFTNGDLLASPESNHVSVDVFYAWNYGYKTDPSKNRLKKPERMSSWFCDGSQFVELNRQGVREYVLKIEMPKVWSAYATTSYKKHGSLISPVNIGKRRVWNFEQRVVDCTNMTRVVQWWEIMNIALRHGISRPIMESLICPPYVIRRIGVTYWTKYYRWAKGKSHSALYSFLCYLLPSQEELKREKISNASNTI